MHRKDGRGIEKPAALAIPIGLLEVGSGAAL